MTNTEKNTRNGHGRGRSRVIGWVAAALLMGAVGCDEGDEAAARELPCDLADPACAARPDAVGALALLDSLGVDVEAAEVELVDVLPEGEPADARPLTLKAEDPRPQAQRWTCNSNSSYSCCCYWDGPTWGCGCD